LIGAGRSHIIVLGIGDSKENTMSDMTMIYWKGERFWLGKIKEHPEIMSQGRAVKELEENLRDAYRMMILEDVPEEHREKAIAVGSGTPYETERRRKRKQFIRELGRDGCFPEFGLDVAQQDSVLFLSV
jgi:predicted RNase H-like HicB family nuclease